MYSIDFKKRVVAYIVEDGNTKADAYRVFKASRSTIDSWLKAESFERKPPPKGHNRKYNWSQLEKIVENNPDLTIQEYASKVGMSTSGAEYAIHQMGFTSKKNRKNIRKDATMRGSVTSKNSVK